MPTSRYSQILDIAKRRGVVRPREIESRGLHREQLARLARRGDLEHVGRGLYRKSGYAVTEKHDLVLACARVPHGVVCLFSALVFHELGTQRALSTWLAIRPHARRPKVDYPPIEVVHMSDASLSAGVETHRFEGVTVRVFSAAKTVADCFKFRNRIGLDVAIEALRDYVRSRGSIAELSRFAKVNRVERIMAPYAEALVS